MRYKLLGTEEGFAVCEFCHKKEISNLYHVEDTETGKMFVFGSSCILKALQIPDSEFKAMKAEKELTELENEISVYNMKIENEMYYGKKLKRVYITIDGERYTRLINAKDEKTAVTLIGHYSNCNTGFSFRFDIKNPTRKILLNYFNKKKHLSVFVKG